MKDEEYTFNLTQWFFMFQRILTLLPLLFIFGCKGDVEPVYPKSDQQVSNEKYGRLIGDQGIVFGGSKQNQSSGITVNSYLWRASLDIISFMPLDTIDPFSGVITTEWYSAVETPSERTKLNIIVASPYLRADAVKVTAFRQKKTASGWENIAVSPEFTRDIEERILTHARELRLSNKD